MITKNWAWGEELKHEGFLEEQVDVIRRMAALSELVPDTSTGTTESVKGRCCDCILLSADGREIGPESVM